MDHDFISKRPLAGLPTIASLPA
jgi:hypothetical protein